MRARKEIERGEYEAGDEEERNKINLEVLLDIRAILLRGNKFLERQEKIVINLLEHRNTIKIT